MLTTHISTVINMRTTLWVSVGSCFNRKSLLHGGSLILIKNCFKFKQHNDIIVVVSIIIVYIFVIVVPYGVRT